MDITEKDILSNNNLTKEFNDPVENNPQNLFLNKCRTNDYKLVTGICMEDLTILVCSTGSVATIKLPEILASLEQKLENLVKLEIVLTEKAKHFCKITQEASPRINVYSDSEWNVEKFPFLPEELAQRASILLIAPLDANTLAKIANGLCDNLLTSTIRVWDFKKIALCCPAMNTQMWTHPITEVQIKTLESLGFIIIPPITKKLACGDFGVGAMAEPNNIAETVKNYAINFMENKICKNRCNQEV